MSLDTHLDGGIGLEELVNNNNGFQCHLCRRTCPTKADFKLHLKQHGKQDRFACPSCHRNFDSSTQLWHHLSKSHRGSGQGLVCGLCDNKTFKHAFNYHLHMLIHLEERPEKCRYCAKAFRTKPSLRKHELIHTGHKPHPCHQCNSTFKTKDELKQHSISHTTGKPYQCQFCSMSFKYRGSLTRHEKKGRCQIGKHWCPTKRRRGRQENVPVDVLFLDPSPLFCDVFLGWPKSEATVKTTTEPV